MHALLALCLFFLPSVAVASISSLDGVAVDPFDGQAKATVLVFVDVDCPISNRYAPEVRRIYRTFKGREVRFFLVYAHTRRTPEEIRAHVKAYDYPMPALRDVTHELVRKTGARVTPETVVINGDREVVYIGRIDDRFPSFGKARPAPTQRDLATAIRATLDGQPIVVKKTKAVGCHIPKPR